MNFATWDDILETHADIVAMNNIIGAHDMANSVQAERLRAVEVLLAASPTSRRSPCSSGRGAGQRTLISSAGISDANYRRLFVVGAAPWLRCTTTDHGLLPPMWPTGTNPVWISAAPPVRKIREGRTHHLHFGLGTWPSRDKLLLGRFFRGRVGPHAGHHLPLSKAPNRNAVVRHDDAALLRGGHRRSARLRCWCSAHRVFSVLPASRRSIH